MIAEYLHLIFRSTLLYILFSSVGMAQVVPQGDRKISFEGRSLSIDEYLSNADANSALKDKRLKQLDPSAFLSPEKHENLWKNNIELRIELDPRKTSDIGGKKDTVSSSKIDRVRLDRIGGRYSTDFRVASDTMC